MISEQSGHVLIDVHTDHVLFGVAEDLTHVFGKILDFSFFLNKVYENSAIIRIEDIDLGFIGESFFKQLTLGDFFELGLLI